MNNKKGFTLIEVILSMTILASMMVLVSISISNATKAKRKIQTEVEAVSSLRDAMRILRTDINLAYNHYDFELDILEKSREKTAALSATNQIVPPRPAGSSPIGSIAGTSTAPTIRKSPATHFVGTDNTINFVTTNNGRITANDIQADFIEVGYSLKNCKNFTGDNGSAVEKKSQGKCLYRRTQKIIDQDVSKGGDEIVILEDVTEFSLKYLVENKLDLQKEWRSEKKRYNIFPDAVEVTLAIEKEQDKKQKKYSIQYVVPLHFPNNIKSNKNIPAVPTGTTTLSEDVTQ